VGRAPQGAPRALGAGREASSLLSRLYQKHVVFRYAVPDGQLASQLAPEEEFGQREVVVQHVRAKSFEVFFISSLVGQF
jgi:hypothetical protein